MHLFDEAFSDVASGPTLSANLTWRPNDNWASRTQFEYSNFNINEGETSRRDDNREQTVFQFGLDRQQGEVSSELSRNLLGGRAKVIALYNFLEDNENSSSRRDREVQSPDASWFLVDLTQTETVLRSEYERTLRPGHSYQLAAEFARNTLDSRSAFFNLEPDTNVTENRLEPPPAAMPRQPNRLALEIFSVYMSHSSVSLNVDNRLSRSESNRDRSTLRLEML